MRNAQGWWCDLRNEPEEHPGCERKATTTFVCVIEGREVALCNNCNRIWRERVKLEPEQANRCPLCSKHAIPVTMPARQPALGRALAGPVAEIIDDAMFREGLLVDVRARVLRRLATEPVIQACAEFVEMWNENRQAVAASFGVSPSELGSGDGRSLRA